MAHLPSGQPTREEFLTWVEQPVTQWAMQALRAAAEAQRTAWVARSWGPDLEGEVPRLPLGLTEEFSALKARADAYLALEQTGYDRFCLMNDQDPTAGDAQ